MRIEEIREVLSISDNEVPVYLPNETFGDLQKYIISAPDIAYAYSYIYLANFLYRNCKYFNVESILDTNIFKEILGYSTSNRTMNYLTKRNGLLDEIGYFESTKDYPVAWRFEQGVEDLSFLMSSELEADELAEVPKRFFLKKPLRAFERTLELPQDDETIATEDIIGSFFDVANTHTVPFEVFMFFMSQKDLGTVGFYLYSWLKHKNDLFPQGYDVPMEKLSEETGVPMRTLITYMGALKGHRVIDFKHNQAYFAVGMEEGDRKANTYMTNDYYSFLDVAAPYERIRKISNKKYLEIKAEEKSKNEVEVRSTIDDITF